MEKKKRTQLAFDINPEVKQEIKILATSVLSYFELIFVGLFQEHPFKIEKVISITYVLF